MISTPWFHWAASVLSRTKIIDKGQRTELIAKKAHCSCGMGPLPQYSFASPLLSNGTLIDFFKNPRQEITWHQTENKQSHLSKKILYHENLKYSKQRNFQPCLTSFKPPPPLAGPSATLDQKLWLIERKHALSAGSEENPAMYTLLSNPPTQLVRPLYFLSWYPEFIKAMTETRYRYTLSNLSGKNTSLRIESSTTFKDYNVALLTRDDFRQKLSGALYLYSTPQSHNALWDLLIVEDQQTALILPAIPAN